MCRLAQLGLELGARARGAALSLHGQLALLLGLLCPQIFYCARSAYLIGALIVSDYYLLDQGIASAQIFQRLFLDASSLGMEIVAVFGVVLRKRHLIVPAIIVPFRLLSLLFFFSYYNFIEYNDLDDKTRSIIEDEIKASIYRNTTLFFVQILTIVLAYKVYQKMPKTGSSFEPRSMLAQMSDAE